MFFVQENPKICRQFLGASPPTPNNFWFKCFKVGLIEKDKIVVVKLKRILKTIFFFFEKNIILW